MVGPFPLAEVIDRLKAHVPLAKVIGTAADLDSAVEIPPNANPALYVLTEERGGEGKYSGPVTIQNVEVILKVVRLVRSASGEKHGRGARKKTDEIAGQIRAALIGWTPGDAFEAITFQSGRDDQYRSGWLAGQELFRTQYRIQHQALT